MRLIAPGHTPTLDAPRWLRDAFAGAPEKRELESGAIAIAEGEAIVRLTRAGIASSDASTTRRAAAEMYEAAFAALDEAGIPHAVRAWNFVPDLLAPLDGVDRYMAFNAGRHEAMRARFGEMMSSAPAGTAVGHGGDALTIVVLATREPGEPIENRLQTPAYRYSPRFGPLPPCFSRATRATWRGRPTLFVSGTAAIRGEASCCTGDAPAQLAMTLDNLRELLRCAGVRAGDDVLEAFESLRAYVPRGADAVAIRERLARPNVEITPVAALCREELLIEIEGVVALPR